MSKGFGVERKLDCGAGPSARAGIKVTPWFRICTGFKVDQWRIRSSSGCAFIGLRDQMESTPLHALIGMVTEKFFGDFMGLAMVS